MDRRQVGLGYSLTPEERKARAKRAAAARYMTPDGQPETGIEARALRARDPYMRFDEAAPAAETLLAGLDDGKAEQAFRRREMEQARER